MSCTVTCGALNSLRDSCKRNACIAGLGLCQLQSDYDGGSCLDYCCPTNDGAIAGIVISLLVCIAGCVYYFCFRQRTQKVEQPSTTQAAETGNASPAAPKTSEASDRLGKLKKMHDDGFISQEEYDKKRTEILGEL